MPKERLGDVPPENLTNFHQYNKLSMTNRNRNQPTRQGNNIRKAIKAELNRLSEVKQYMFDQGPTATPSAGVIYNLSQFIIQGLDINQRSGDKIFLEQVELRLNSFLPTLGVAGAIRYIIFMDKKANGIVPTVGDVLETAQFTSNYDIVNSSGKRFQILLDKSHAMSTGSNQEIVVHIKRSVSKAVHYNGATAVATSNGTNSLYILLITDLAVNPPNHYFDLTMFYRDS